jgi:Mandelate racemase / muconate lactonizing enzyme, N-terminal domain
MRIESIPARAVRVPLTTPTTFSTPSIDAREYVIVRIVAESGVSRIGSTHAGDPGGLWLKSGTKELLAPRLPGRNASVIEECWARSIRDLPLRAAAPRRPRACRNRERLCGRRARLAFDVNNGVEDAGASGALLRRPAGIRHLVDGGAVPTGRHCQSGSPCGAFADPDRNGELEATR